MPPRTVKRGGATRRTPRVRKAQNQHLEMANKPANVEEVMVTAVEPQEETKVESKPSVVKNPILEEKPVVEKWHSSEENGALHGMKKEDEARESGEEFEKEEQLELEDNDPEFEPEEYGGMDYDEKETEEDDFQEVGDEVEEELEEENIGVEEEGDMAEEELEELRGEEDDKHVGDEHEHVEMADVEDEDHHEHFKERRKRKEFEVFVGGLNKDATEGDLREVFNSVGEVTEVRLMMNPLTKKNKGFAFLRFATVEQAKRAVAELKHPVINGKQCGVTPSQDSDTLFLGNICKTWTKEALKEKLKHYRVENVEDLTLVEDSNREGMNRGFAFLEFSSRSDAMDAFKRLQKRDTLFGVDRPAKVSFADSFIDPGDEIMAQVKTVFVDGLLASWDEDHVLELLKKYGNIDKIELARNMPSAKRKNFGFVTFCTHDAAVTCAKSINNAELGEGDHKVKVRARLSRPLQRGKEKHVSHGDKRSGRASGRVIRGSWSRPASRSFPDRGIRGFASRPPPPNIKRPIGLRDRRPPVSMSPRGRPLVPFSRSYDRRAPVPSYPKSNMKREYGRRDELPPPRSRAVSDYGSRAVPERHPSYRDYPSRGSGYSDMPRSTSRPTARRGYTDNGYEQRFERPPPSYREGHSRDYNSISGSKRPYAALDDVPPLYSDAGVRRSRADLGVRQSRARLDYEYSSGPSHYGDAYGDRPGRSSVGYGSSRSSISNQDSQGFYGSREGISYGGSYGDSDVGGMYSSSYGSDYMSRGSDVGGSSYSSMYSSRGGSSYMGTGGSGTYY